MKFEEINKQMGPLLNKLKASDAYREETLNDLRIHSGAYVFYERCKPMYVGIVGRHSKNNIGGRIKQHGNGAPKLIPRWDVHFEGLEGYRRDSTEPHITHSPQLGDHRYCGLAICTFHLGFSLGATPPVSPGVRFSKYWRRAHQWS